MKDGALKLIFVPWGSSDYGFDLWLFENALVLCLESVVESLRPIGTAQYADLYGQLQGDAIGSARFAPFTPEQLRKLAERAPSDTDAIVDGMLIAARDPDTNALRSIRIAPRVTLLPGHQVETPDAFVFEGFEPHRQSRDECRIAGVEEFSRLAAAVAESVLAAVGVAAPDLPGPNQLQMTPSWAAFAEFVRAKRLAKTSEEKKVYYRQAVASDGDFYWALYNLGQILKTERDFAGARRVFMNSVKAADGQAELLADAYFEIGLCSVSLGDPKTARKFWEQGLSYAPDNPTLLINIAGTYEQEENYQKAIALNEQVLAGDPAHHKALVDLGRLKAMLGDLDSAIDFYERALALRPDDALREAILGGCYLARGDNDSARSHLETASRLDPPRARLAPVTGSDPLDERPAPGEYARQELTKLDDFARAKKRR